MDCDHASTLDLGTDRANNVKFHWFRYKNATLA